MNPSAKIAVCPGSYDPVTNGHLDIIGAARRCSSGWSSASSGQGIRKSKAMFSAEERRDFCSTRPLTYRNVGIEIFTNLVVDFAKEQGASVIIKGIRAISDFEYELEMNQLNRKLAREIESVYVFASPDYSFLSSTGVKEMATFGADISTSFRRPSRRRLRSGRGATDGQGACKHMPKTPV